MRVFSQINNCQQKKQKTKNKSKNKQNSRPPWAGKRLEFSVTELAKGPFPLQKERKHKSQDKCEPKNTVS